MANLTGMPGLPSMPKVKQQVRCACGCQGLTQSRFVPGHDAKLYGWMRRVKAGVFNPEKATDVTAQLDASLQWLTDDNVKALATALGVTWKRKEEKKTA